jgi:putative AlgH/UPF0301 family transcriptional regulator
MLLTLQWIALICAACLFHLSFSFQPWGRILPDRRISGSRLWASPKADEEDWRAFRAKLVMNETKKSSTTSSSSSSWTYDAGLLVEKGSIVLSRVESSLGCHDLRQPYFMKCVVLIVEHDENEFTQGIILNRPSNLQLGDQDIVYLDDEGSLLLEDASNSCDDTSTTTTAATTKDEDSHPWRMFFGGDIAGLYDEEPLIVCLHNLTSDLAQSVSDSVLPGVSITSHLSARALVEAGEATPESFYTFYGFCGWDPGQLELEVQRGSWYMVSTDPQTLWSELEGLRDPSYDPRSVGLTMWQGILDRLGKLTEPVGERNAFAELMLKEWATLMLLVSNDDDNNNKDQEDSCSSTLEDSDIHRALHAADQPPVAAGSLLRGSSLDVSPFLLHDQFFHKSTILVLQETDALSVGLVLNLPTTDYHSVDLADGTTANFPIRYGGHSGKNNNKNDNDNINNNIDDDDDDDDTKNEIYNNSKEEEGDEEPLVWLHCNIGLKYLRLGKPINIADDSGVWICTQDQVIQSIDLEFGAPEDFLLIQGFCVWEKEEAGSAGGIQGQILSGNLEPSITSENRDQVWVSLLKQERLTEESLDTNLEMALTAWNHGGVTTTRPTTNTGMKSGDSSRVVYDTDIQVNTLADEALMVWIKIFLLGNAEYYQ